MFALIELYGIQVQSVYLPPHHLAHTQGNSGRQFNHSCLERDICNITIFCQGFSIFFSKNIAINMELCSDKIIIDLKNKTFKNLSVEYYFTNIDLFHVKRENGCLILE